MDETGNNNDDEVDDIEDNLSVSDNENDMISGTHSTNLNTMENDVNQSGNGQDARSLPAQVVTRPSLVDVNEWRTEVERVAPKLRSSQRRINSEWRQRVEQATSSANKVETTLTLAQADLTALSRYV